MNIFETWPQFMGKVFFANHMWGSLGWDTHRYKWDIIRDSWKVFVVAFEFANTKRDCWTFKNVGEVQHYRGTKQGW
jgi:hypothetical protein